MPSLLRPIVCDLQSDNDLVFLILVGRLFHLNCILKLYDFFLDEICSGFCDS